MKRLHAAWAPDVISPGSRLRKQRAGMRRTARRRGDLSMPCRSLLVYWARDVLNGRRGLRHHGRPAAECSRATRHPSARRSDRTSRDPAWLQLVLVRVFLVADQPGVGDDRIGIGARRVGAHAIMLSGSSADASAAWPDAVCGRDELAGLVLEQAIGTFWLLA